MDELRGRVAVVTGGGSGIGAGLARACARAGMHVAVADVEAEAAGRTTREIADEGLTAQAFGCDVTDAAAVQGLAAEVDAAFGGCHLLCNNAGVEIVGTVAERSVEDWQWLLGVNLMGVAHGLNAFLPAMIERGGPGHIVNTASLAGLLPLPERGLYVASKYAVVGLSEVLEGELAPHGIGVTVLCPGAVQSRIHESARNRPRELGGGAPVPEAPVGTDAGLGSMAEILTPDQAGEITLEAVRRGQLYAFTHPAWAGAVAERSRRMADAFESMRALRKEIGIPAPE